MTDKTLPRSYVVYELATGRILQRMHCPPAAAEGALKTDQGLLEGGASWETHYVANETLVAFPARPSTSHVWNWTTKAWDPSTDILRSQHHAAIEAERDRRLVAPVLVYDGKNLDADQRAQDNLSDVLSRVHSALDRGVALPASQLVWKDYDNVVHTFADTAAYKVWLDGFALAMGDRNIAAWGWSWQKKNDLAALTTYDELAAFNPEI